jgi:hypothetical protein
LLQGYGEWQLVFFAQNDNFLAFIDGSDKMYIDQERLADPQKPAAPRFLFQPGQRPRQQKMPPVGQVQLT